MLLVQKTFKNNLSTIYIVGTPIGNLEDFSYRAIEILNNVDIICCEDTRTSSILLKKYNINKKLISLHKFNESKRIDELSKYIKESKKIAIISDAGVPCISDPGMYILNQLKKSVGLNFNITAVNVGPAYIHALVSSGLEYETNYFSGFLDKKENNLKKQISDFIDIYKNFDIAICMYESVHRIQKTISYLYEVLDKNTNIIVGREITKLNEEFIRGTIQEVYNFSITPEFILKGEFCIILELKKQPSKSLTKEEVVKKVNVLIEQGFKLKDALNILAKSYTINKQQLYKELQKL